jgi:hypothetical protein
MDQLRSKLGNPIGVRLAPADFKHYVLSFDVAQLVQTLPECVNERRRHGSGRGNEEPYTGDVFRLLRLDEMNASEK